MSEQERLSYATMQKLQYDSPNSSPEDVVGFYDWHENFPYETFLLYHYGDVRKPLFDNFSDKRAFDVACGEGRMIRRFEKIFKAVDGADISKKMVEAARERCPKSYIYLTNGMDCGDAPSDSYDFVYCTISLQHICVHAIRTSILKHVVRILKPGGKATLQMMFSKHFPFVPSIQQLAKIDNMDVFLEISARTGQHAEWLDNRYDAEGTNGTCDVLFGQKDIPLVKKDMEELFGQCDMCFFDITAATDRLISFLPVPHPNAHSPNHNTHFAFLYCLDPRK